VPTDVCCVICRDDFDVGSHIALTPCSHGYCLECWRGWRTAAESGYTPKICPMCRQSDVNRAFVFFFTNGIDIDLWHWHHQALTYDQDGEHDPTASSSGHINEITILDGGDQPTPPPTQDPDVPHDNIAILDEDYEQSTEHDNEQPADHAPNGITMPEGSDSEQGDGDDSEEQLQVLLEPSSGP
jgi:hypothetical protein